MDHDGEDDETIAVDFPQDDDSSGVNDTDDVGVVTKTKVDSNIVM